MKIIIHNWPRQTGKTTYAKHLASTLPFCGYIDNLSHRRGSNRYQEVIRGFKNLVIDDPTSIEAWISELLISSVYDEVHFFGTYHEKYIERTIGSIPRFIDVTLERFVREEK